MTSITSKLLYREIRDAVTSIKIMDDPLCALITYPVLLSLYFFPHNFYNFCVHHVSTSIFFVRFEFFFFYYSKQTELNGMNVN